MTQHPHDTQLLPHRPSPSSPRHPGDTASPGPAPRPAPWLPPGPRRWSRDPRGRRGPAPGSHAATGVEERGKSLRGGKAGQPPPAPSHNRARASEVPPPRRGKAPGAPRDGPGVAEGLGWVPRQLSRCPVPPVPVTCCRGGAALSTTDSGAGPGPRAAPGAGAGPVPGPVPGPGAHLKSL